MGNSGIITLSQGCLGKLKSTTPGVRELFASLSLKQTILVKFFEF